MSPRHAAPRRLPSVLTGVLRVLVAVLCGLVPSAWAGTDAIADAGTLQLLVETERHVSVRSATVREPVEADFARRTTRPLFEDYFFDNRERWTLDEDAYFAEDGYHIHPSSATDAVWRYRAELGPYVADAAAEVALRFVEGPSDAAFGVALRSRSSPSDAYRLFITPDGSAQIDRVTEADGLRILFPLRPVAAVRPGTETNVLRFVARGPVLTASVNGQHIASIEDTVIGAPGAVDLIARSGTHVVVRSIVVAEPDAQDEAALSTVRQADPAPCLPAIEDISIDPGFVRVRVRNTCSTQRTLGMSLVLLDKPGGQPLSTISTQRWDASTGETRELTFLGTTRGAGAVLALPTNAPSTAPTQSETACFDVGARRCLVSDPWLYGAVEALRKVDRGPWLLAVAAERGVQLKRLRLPSNLNGRYSPALLEVTLDLRLDAFSEWERAAVLAHELQHAADDAAGILGRSPAICYRREEDAFRREAAVWDALWKGALPAATTNTHRTLNRIVEDVRTNREQFVQDLTTAYEHQCG